MAKQYLTHRRVNFSAGVKIGACQRVERCFPARFPPECISERDAHVGVLVDRNGGRRKILPEKVVNIRVFRGGCGFCEAL